MATYNDPATALLGAVEADLVYRRPEGDFMYFAMDSLNVTDQIAPLVASGLVVLGGERGTRWRLTDAGRAALDARRSVR